MSKEKTIEKLITGKDEGKTVNFYCFQKSYGFSLPAFEVGDDGKFVLDGNKQRKPLFEDNEEGKVKRRKRAQFQFSLIPDAFASKGEHGKTVKFECVFSLKGDELYYEDLLKKLTSEANDRSSPVHNSIQYLQAKDHGVFKAAEKFANREESLLSTIDELKDKIAKLEGSKK